MNTTPPNPQGPSIWARLWKFFIRLIFVIVVGIVLGAGIFWAAQVFYRQYIQRLQEYGSRLDVLEARQDMQDEQLTGRLSDYQTRVNSLETLQDSDKQKIAELQGQMDKAKSDLAEGQAGLEKLLAQVEKDSQVQSDLSLLHDELVKIQSSQETLLANLETIQKDLAALEKSHVDQQTQIEELAQVVNQKDELWNTMQLEMQLIKTMELLTRARFSLAQNNLGQAESNIQQARNLLAELRGSASDDQAGKIDGVIEYLDEAISALPLLPLRASDNLESAWQMIIQSLLPAPAPGPSPEFTPTPTPSGTPTPYP
jgi:chromosome segregation ATPase